jgi:hypothetical protein
MPVALKVPRGRPQKPQANAPRAPTSPALSYTAPLRDDPLVLEQPLGQSFKRGQMIAMRGGANLETAMLMCAATSAFPYTNMRTRWHEILSAHDELSETARVWSPFAKAFRGDLVPAEAVASQRMAVIRRIRRTPALSFGPPEWLAADALDETYFRLLPSGQSTVTAEEAAMLAAVFGEDGELPARPAGTSRWSSDFRQPS